MKNALVIGQNELGTIEALKRFAFENIFSPEEIDKIKEGKALPPGDREGFRMRLPLRYHVVYSMCRHREFPGDTFQHLSVSVSGGGKYGKYTAPNFQAMNMIAHSFGFKELPADLAKDDVNKKAIVWFDKDSGSVNVKEKVDV